MNEQCYVIPVEKIVTPEEQKNITFILLYVQGMGCENCAMRVRNSLISLQGVVQAEVSHITGTARILFNAEIVTPFDLAEAVAAAGNDGRHRYQVIVS